jgi:hypothetical protein
MSTSTYIANMSSLAEDPALREAGTQLPKRPDYQGISSYFFACFHGLRPDGVSQFPSQSVYLDYQAAF